MSKGCRFFGEEADFQHWFVDCVMVAMDEKNCPDDYVWDMNGQCENGGEWLDMFRSGLTAKAAINVKFNGLKLNS